MAELALIPQPQQQWHVLFWCYILYIVRIKFKAVVYRPWILPATIFWITILGWALYLGFNVAFPTETVYGLGASIWSLSAINSIYEKKGRPSTNPLIVHIPSYDHVYHHDLTRMTVSEQSVFKILAHEFWPGPVTFVVRANTDKVHPQLRNGTPYVGLRVPNHPVALALLQTAGVPIAAPSANRSGNVSPDIDQHVADDYKGLNIFMPILGDDCDGYKKKVGVESTIIKVDESANGIVCITILRAGAIGLTDITKALEKVHIDVPYDISAKSNEVDNETSESPGKALKHYSPKHAKTYKGIICEHPTSAHISTLADYGRAILIAPNTVVNKYGGEYHKCYTLPDDSKECARVLYSTMREADAYCKEFEDAVIVMCIEGIHAEKGCGFMGAIKDKVYRASEGNKTYM